MASELCRNCGEPAVEQNVLGWWCRRCLPLPVWSGFNEDDWFAAQGIDLNDPRWQSIELTSIVISDDGTVTVTGELPALILGPPLISPTGPRRTVSVDAT